MSDYQYKLCEIDQLNKLASDGIEHEIIGCPITDYMGDSISWLVRYQVEWCDCGLPTIRHAMIDGHFVPVCDDCDPYKNREPCHLCDGRGCEFCNHTGKLPTVEEYYSDDRSEPPDHIAGNGDIPF